jgi:hypothetical protein
MVDEILFFLLFLVIKILNTMQWIKAGFYTLIGVDYRVIRDHKFGEITVRKVKE